MKFTTCSRFSIATLTALSLMTGCANNNTSKKESTEDDLPMRKDQAPYAGMGKLFGDDALTFGGNKSDPEVTTGIGVNTYLWRASLDTVSFMPLHSVDPFGGVIITDWYTSSSAPHERMKATIVILDRSLRTDGLKVNVFKQIRSSGSAEWRDTDVAPEVVRKLEDTILTRARQMRVQAEGTS